MRRFLPTILVVLMVMIECSVLPVLVVSWACPMITFTGVIVLGLLLGRSRGLFYGMMAGLLIDILFATPLGYNAVLYLLAGYAAGIAGRRFQRHLLTPVVTPVVLLSMFEMVSVGYLYLAGATLNTILLRNALVRIAAGTVLAQALYLLFNLLLKPVWSRFAAK